MRVTLDAGVALDAELGFFDGLGSFALTIRLFCYNGSALA